MTPTDLCTNALIQLGVVAPGETPGQNQLVQAYNRLNRLLDLWGIERQTINGVQKFTKVVTVGHNPYTIGAGGDFNQARPSWIDAITLILPNSGGITPSEIVVELVGKDQYETLAAKTVQAQVAQWAYYDLAGPPTGNLYFYPVLNDATITIALWLPVALTQFTSPTQTITLLPGYQAALETNLAVTLAPEFGRPLDPGLAAQAAQALGWIKRANLQVNLQKTDIALLNQGANSIYGNWYTGP